MTTTPPIVRRKADHIAINLEQDVRAPEGASGFDHYQFVHSALPEMDLADADPGTRFLGRTLQAPILISSMTGGVERGYEINRNLATAAQALGCAMGVGSQRAAIEDVSREQFFPVRDIAPDILLFANLGAVQLNYGFGIDQCRQAVDMIDADALILHLNPLQEALQPEGNRDFTSLLQKIESVCTTLEVPVVVKEVGFGISATVAHQLADAGVAAIDVSGAGGTSWSAVEHHRADTDLARRLSATFVHWGIPTATSLLLARQGAPHSSRIASGGMRTGLDAAKAIALGADLVGFAGPLLQAAATGEEETLHLLTALIEEIRLAMFCTSSRTLSDLRRAEMIVTADQPRLSTGNELTASDGSNTTP